MAFFVLGWLDWPCSNPLPSSSYPSCWSSPVFSFDVSDQPPATSHVFPSIVALATCTSAASCLSAFLSNLLCLPLPEYISSNTAFIMSREWTGYRKVEEEQSSGKTIGAAPAPLCQLDDVGQEVSQPCCCLYYIRYISPAWLSSCKEL